MMIPETGKTEETKIHFRWHPFYAWKLWSGDVIGVVLTVAYFLRNLAEQGIAAILIIYFEYYFHWDSIIIGIVLTILGASFFITNTFATPILKRKLSDRDLVVYGLGGDAITVTAYGILYGYEILPLYLFRSLSSIDDPTLQALISKQYSQAVQGNILGVVNSVKLSTFVIGPIIVGDLFAYFISADSIYYMPQVGFYFGGIFYSISLIVAVTLFALKPERQRLVKQVAPINEGEGEEESPILPPNTGSINDSEETREIIEEVYIVSNSV